MLANGSLSASSCNYCCRELIIICSRITIANSQITVLCRRNGVVWLRVVWYSRSFPPNIIIYSHIVKYGFACSASTVVGGGPFVGDHNVFCSFFSRNKVSGKIGFINNNQPESFPVCLRITFLGIGQGRTNLLNSVC